MAIRPLESDRVGLLFSYTQRSLIQDVNGTTPTRDRSDSLSSDGYYQMTKRLELYGRFAGRFSANGQPQLPFVSTLTFLTQARAQYLITRRLAPMMVLSAMLGAFSSIIGLYLSYYLNIVSGSAIVLTATLFFVLAFLFNSRQGILRRRINP